MGPKKRQLPRQANDINVNLSGFRIDSSVTSIGDGSEVSAKRIKIKVNGQAPKVSPDSNMAVIENTVVPISGGKIKVDEDIDIERNTGVKADEEKKVSDQPAEVNEVIKVEDRLTITVKEISITASRAILQRKAPQFAEMLEQGAAIENVEVPVFEALLNYAQTGKIDDEFMKQNSVDVLIAAKQYKYADMQAKALEYIKSSK